MFDTSLLIAFLAGTAAGAAGQYMADRFTDQRRTQEKKRELEREFDQIRGAMPRLFSEMKTDLTKDGWELVREFVLLPNRNVIFNGDRLRFTYYVSDHEDLVNQVAMLADRGYIRYVSHTNTPIYRMTDDLVSRIRTEI